MAIKMLRKPHPEVFCTSKTAKDVIIKPLSKMVRGFAQAKHLTMRLMPVALGIIYVTP
jgi:hypothetical protein